MKHFFPIIKKSPIFAGLTEEELDAILHCLDGKTGSYEKNQFLLRPGEQTQAVGLVLSGRVLILQEDFWGNRNLLSQVGPGQIFAEAFACSLGAVLTVAVLADSPTTVLWLHVGRILSTCPTVCSHHSQMIRNLLGDLAGKNLRFSEKLGHMGQRTTREKLLSYLSAEARRQGSGDFEIPFNRQQLADYLSVERSALSTTLGRLRDEGQLTFSKNHFVLLARQP